MPRMKEESHPKAEASAIDEDWVPPDMDAYRIELARYINRFLADHERCWELCRERECRRARACRSPHIECPMLPPPPVLTPEEDMRWRAEVHYAVKARVAEIERGEADEIDQQS